MNRLSKHFLGLLGLIALLMMMKTPVLAIHNADGTDNDGRLRQISCTER